MHLGDVKVVIQARSISPQQFPLRTQPFSPATNNSTTKTVPDAPLELYLHRYWQLQRPYL